ncbi:uncharacterized protein LOC125759882 isoform X2 [Rhipicephalus sanguineus]|uniref:uncharacterized protein LOC125759882 isoform X2 n=1 Tax=Rhipicephalus sanguineus TaxID=34632 RepID=UPI0020C34CF0|nr:uncharacterized protein LOC125759882 isoform X2 [Rhipicephalus sanguineus]
MDSRRHHKSCCAEWCRNSSRHTGIKFFRIPADERFAAGREKYPRNTQCARISRLASVCETAGPGSFTASSDLQQLPPVLCPFHQQRLRRPWTDKAAKMCCANSFHLWRWADTRRKSRFQSSGSTTQAF